VRSTQRKNEAREVNLHPELMQVNALVLGDLVIGIIGLIPTVEHSQKFGTHYGSRSTVWGLGDTLFNEVDESFSVVLNELGRREVNQKPTISITSRGLSGVQEGSRQKSLTLGSTEATQPVKLESSGDEFPVMTNLISQNAAFLKSGGIENIYEKTVSLRWTQWR
jgi:hypothetical protein